MARCLCCVNAFRFCYRSFVLPQLRGTHSAVEPVICVSLQQRRLAVSKFQDTRTVTSLGCIETKSSRRTQCEPAHWCRIIQMTLRIILLSPSVYIYIHTHNRSLRLLHGSLLRSFHPQQTQNRGKPFTLRQPYTEPRSANLCPIHQHFWRSDYTSESNSHDT